MEQRSDELELEQWLAWLLWQYIFNAAILKGLQVRFFNKASLFYLRKQIHLEVCKIPSSKIANGKDSIYIYG